MKKAIIFSMGSANIESTSGGQDTNFNSRDIKEHTKAGEQKEYFVKFKEETFGQKFSRWFDENKKKIIVILCSIAGAVLLVLLTLWVISILTKPAEPVATEPIDFGNEIAEIRVEMEDYVLASREGNPYEDLNNHYNEMAESESDPTRKFEIKMALVMFYINNGDYEEAQTIHATIEGIDKIGDDGKMMFFQYGQLLCNYQNNKSCAQYYESTIKLNFPDYFTVTGGDDGE